MSYLKLEQAMIDALNKHHPDDAKGLIARYDLAKEILFKQILPWIRTNEPTLTDHGPDHIDNVLNNAYLLIESDIEEILNTPRNNENKLKLKSIDLYFLSQAILFHDVGNFFGRKKHNLNIYKVMDGNFSNLFTGEHLREKGIIIKIGRAHCGKGLDDSDDTLKNLDVDQCNGKKIQLRDIAAIVRLADELAEGPQRTSHYMQEQKEGGFSGSSELFHRYASVVDHLIDPTHERISIKYTISIETNNKRQITKESEKKLSELLKFIYIRIDKLDTERKYCSYYCDSLKRIKKTIVDFEIDNNEINLDFKLETLVLTDLIVPNGKHDKVIKENPKLKVSNVIRLLKDKLKEINVGDNYE